MVGNQLRDAERISRRGRYVKTVCILIALTFCAQKVSALKGNKDKEQQHGSWQSSTLSLGDERLSRAVVINGDRSFNLDFRPPECGPTMYVVEMLSKYADEDDEDWVEAKARVDTRTIVFLDGLGQTRRGENIRALKFAAKSDVAQQQLVKDIRSGHQLRLEIDEGANEPTYIRFPLNGAARAITRAKSLCSTLQDDSAFFQDPD